MEKRRLSLKWIGAVVIFTSILTLGDSVQCFENVSKSAFRTRPDIVTIETLKVYGNLERPEVLFLHDLHAEALEKKNKNCSSCHQSENGRLSYNFKRIKKADRQTVMDMYHDDCIACHTEMINGKEKTGPIVCGGCHKKQITIVSSRIPMGFDRSLHYRHYEAQKKKCERCHHEYDKRTQKLFYAKGKEGTCRYCHQQDIHTMGSDKPISMRTASHLACIDCHQKTTAKQIHAGPVLCSGCHDQKEQRKIEKIDHVPRIKRGQPDVVLIKTGDKKGKEPRMMRVPFSHKAHEEYNDTCRVCHLASLKSCDSCHPLTTVNNSKDISLETAFHKPEHKSSCMGCHESKKEDKKCAGCHAFIEKTRQQELSTCLRCHMAPLPERTGVLSTSKAAKMARMMPQIWRETFGSTYKVTVPKKVIIKNLVNFYEPVEFPHRKIFNTLVKQADTSKLAQYFHYDKTTLCIGCHHNTPSAGKPPRCDNCHAKPFDKNYLLRPGIRASYHQQCIGCHQIMGIDKYQSCTACHKERKQKIAKIE